MPENNIKAALMEGLNKLSDWTMDNQEYLDDLWKAPETKLELLRENNALMIGVISDMMIALRNM